MREHVLFSLSLENWFYIASLCPTCHHGLTARLELALAVNRSGGYTVPRFGLHLSWVLTYGSSHQKKYDLLQMFPSVRLAKSESSGVLVKMQILGPSESRLLRTGTCIFIKHSRWFWFTVVRTSKASDLEQSALLLSRLNGPLEDSVFTGVGRQFLWLPRISDATQGCKSSQSAEVEGSSGVCLRVGWCDVFWLGGGLRETDNL